LKYYTDQFKVEHITEFKQQMLNWANRFNICCFLDNNYYKSPYHSFECVAAIADELAIDSSKQEISLIRLEQFFKENKNWLFGHISYDFKNYIFPFNSNQYDGIEAPVIALFKPKIFVRVVHDAVFISSNENNVNQIFNDILSIRLFDYSSQNFHQPIQVESRISKDEYCNIIKNLKQHIQQGDCYEINFCQEFYATNVELNPLQKFQQLNNISPNPFNTFYKLHDIYSIGASPERFLKKIGNKIISQPIKGTIKRDLSNSIQDELLKQQLRESEKEKSENVMIVDLVRNDLSKIAERNSVKVEELFGLYSFPQVYQMISTISAVVDYKINFIEVLKALFPMGSMTGAPKYKVMQLIEEYEKTKRGIYSGSIGYITPDNDFDFNVVIRTIVYNQTKKYLSYQVGSAITIKSNPEQEFEECLTKAQAIVDTLKK